MKKFLEKYNQIIEQDVPAEEAPAPAEEVPAPLSPEGEVLLVRLIKKALVTNIKPEDIETISQLKDINEVNAKQTLATLIGTMKKYTTDIDVDI